MLVDLVKHYCVRHLAYEMLGYQKACGSTVLPSSLKDGQCDLFYEATVRRYAKGSQRIADLFNSYGYDADKLYDEYVYRY